MPGSSNAPGSAVSYSEVVEKYSNGGYVIHKFTNFDNGHMDELADTYLQPQRAEYDGYNDKSLERGHPIEKAVYDAQGNILSKETHTYKRLSDDFVKIMKIGSFTTCPSVPAVAYEGYAQRIYTYRFVVDSSTTFLYEKDNPHPFINRKIFAYNAQGMRSETREIQEDQTEQMLRYVYIADYSNIPYLYACNQNYLECREYCIEDTRGQGKIALGECWAECSSTKSYCESRARNGNDALSRLIYQMQDKYMIGMPTEEQLWIKKDGQPRLLRASFYEYKDFSGGIQLHQIKQINSPVPLVDYTTSYLDEYNRFKTRYKTRDSSAV